ncbi:Cytochrome P450 3A2 [Folsomia candida]|uniref:Cytochrome P450 3A2 n=1 Tax=Folsomia candida TaxID=158441 RepID=A0A226F529_FOLCA|nr:Cytochrome P450 3A2 [Folsomia candida]
MWLISVALFIATVWLLLHFAKIYSGRKLNYWKKQGFPILEETISGWDVFTGKGNDFDNFTDRRAFADDKLFKNGLFGLDGQPWKNMRTFLSPTFTSGRIRQMFSHFEKSANNLTGFIKTKKISATAPPHFDLPLVDAMRKYSMQVITSAAFGLNVNSFHENDKIVPMAERIFIISVSAKIKIAICQKLPKLAKLLNLKVFDPEPTNFFWGLISSSLKTRQESGVKGNDFVQILVDAMNDKSGDKKSNIKWSDDVAIPQAFAFIAAGFDTIANNLSVACYVLATHADIQEELYQVLRRHPAVARLDRICTKDYMLPGNGGKPRIIPKGTVVALPTDAFHKDEQYFPNPYKFDPTRFNKENKAKRNTYAYMPFGIGPRSCIGMRFALVETKVALAYIVRNFVIRPAQGTPVPEKMEKDIVGYKVSSDVKLKFIPRE